MTVQASSSSYKVGLSFQAINMPPFSDILVLGKRCPQGKVGLSQCLNFLEPERFEMVDVDDANAEAVLINKAILKRLKEEVVVDILKKKVFPYITNNEMVNVDFAVTISFDDIKGEFKE